jgi:hypothetical protein
MRADVRPEPPPGEREALEHALCRLLGSSEQAPSAWWREGVRENVLDEDGV